MSQSKQLKRHNKAKRLVAIPEFKTRREESGRGRGSYKRKDKYPTSYEEKI